MDTPLRFPQDVFKLLYWLYFKPFTLRHYVRSLDHRLNERLRLWQVKAQLPHSPSLQALHRLIWLAVLSVPLLGTLIWGSIIDLLILPLLDTAPFNWSMAVPFAVAIGGGAYLIRWHITIHNLFTLLVTLLLGGGIFIVLLVLKVPSGVVVSAMLGIILGMAGGVALSIAIGVALGVAGAVAGGIALSVAAGMVGGVAGGVIVEATISVAVGIAIGMLVGVAWGIAWGMVVGLVGGMAWSVVLSIVGGAAWSGTLSLAGGVAMMVGYFRLFPYIVELPYQWWLTRTAQARPQDALSNLFRSPIYKDEIIWLPLWSLDTHLVLAVQAHREQGQAAIAYVVGSFRQGWAAHNALIEVTALDIEQCRDVTMIAAMQETLTWLPTQLPPALEDILPPLAAIAARAQAALESDLDENRYGHWQQAYEAAKQLRQAITFSRASAGIGRLANALVVWESLLAAARDAAYQHAHQFSIVNPYVVGNPLIDGTQLFKGRGPIFTRLERELSPTTDVYPTLLLFGPRRSGKTSILRQFPSRLGPNFIPLEVNLQSAITAESAAGLLGGIAQQMAVGARAARRLPFSPIDREWLTADPYAAFFHWLQGVMATIQNRLLLLNLDEYERLEEMIGEGRLDNRIFHWLRSLIQEFPNLVILLSGSHTLEQLSPAWSDALINVQLLELGPFTESESLELITTPVPTFTLQYEDAAIAAILQDSGRQPYLIQAICRELVHYLNEHNRRHATAADLEAIMPAVLNRTAGYFNEMWTSPDTDDEQRAVLRLLAREGLTAVAAATLTQQAALPHHNPLRRLLWRQLIEETADGYRLRAGLTARWINDRALT